MSGGRMAFYLPVDLGGMVGYQCALREALAPHGWSVDAVAAGNEAARRHQPELAVPDHVLLAPDVSDPREAAAALCGWLEDRRIDVLHTFGTTEVGDLARAALPRRIRCLVSIHTSTLGSLRIATALREHVNAYVCSSPAPARLLRTLFRVPEDRIDVVPYGIRARPLPPDRFQPRSGALRIASVGRLEGDAKGSDLLVPIAAHLARHGLDFQLDVVGDGPFREALVRSVDAASLGERVRLRGAEGRLAVREALLRSDVFLFPSRTEGFGLALLEAMEAGCAPVATRIPGVTDVLLADGAGLLVEGPRPRAFAAAILSLAARPADRTAIAERARGRALGAFSLERMGDAYAALLARILAAPDRRAPARSMHDLRRPWAWRFGLGAALPAGLKHALRAAAFRLGVTL